MTEEDKTRLRDAATILVVRRDLPGGPRVLMGQRGAAAAFMPSKFVFPGGAVDAGDAQVPLRGQFDADSARRLCHDAGSNAATGLAAAAIRELWEETGLILGTRAAWADPPADWQGFAQAGFRPCTTGLHFTFRAITPPGRTRRFDARFFVTDTTALATDPDDFSAACDELSHLQWVRMAEAHRLDLPFITEVVLAEVQRWMGEGRDTPPSVPFFDNRGPRSVISRID